MPHIYPHFPYKCTNKQLKETVQGYSEEIYKQHGNINTILQISPLLQLGISEIQGRTNRKITYLSLSISILSLIVAGIALYISFQSGEFEGVWKNEQINILNTLKDISNNQVNQLNQINKANEEIKSANYETNAKIDSINKLINSK
jgi:hypothetical protein